MRNTSDRFPKSARGSAAGGQPIGELMHQALAYPDLISLAAGFVDDGSLRFNGRLLHFKLCNRKVKGSEKGCNTEAIKGIGSSASHPRLFVSRFPTRSRSTAIKCSSPLEATNSSICCPTRFLIPGISCCADGVSNLLRLLGNTQEHGGSTFGVESDEQGLCPIALEKTLSLLESQGLGHRVKESISFPTSIIPQAQPSAMNGDSRSSTFWNAGRRRGYDTILIADYAYQELGFEPTDVPPWRSLVPTSDRYVIELGTFSKSFSPGIRIGWGVFPEPMMELMRSMKANIDFGSPNLNQQLMLRVLQSGCLKEHLETLRLTYREKCEAMLSACEEHFSKIPGVHWFRPRGGLYVWLELPSHIPAGTHSPLFQKAIEKGVLYVPGEYCFPDEGVAKRRSSIRLTFGVQSVERIRQGIALLAEAILSLETRI